MDYIRGVKIRYLDNAKDFYETYKRCLRIDLLGEENQYVAVPAFANGFFACELYLKYLLQTNEIQAKGHSLSELFVRLPEHICNAIRFEFNDKAKTFLSVNNISFDELIKKVAYGFEFWRYIHEKENKEFEKDFPFTYSENFLKYFLPIIERIATETQCNNKKAG